MKTNKKTFDCIAFKDAVQTKISEDIRGMSFEEERAYFEKRASAGELGAWWKEVKADQAARTGRAAL